jgi:hypothetical protein
MLGGRPRSSLRSGEFLAVLLVEALLLCHGVFGFAHEISCHECDPPDLLASMSQAGHEHGSEHPIGHEAGQATGDDPVGGHAFAGYFGIVLALFGVVVLGLLPDARSWRRDASPRLYRPCLLPALARLPRGPTLPLLQVFRL